MRAGSLYLVRSIQRGPQSYSYQRIRRIEHAHTVARNAGRYHTSTAAQRGSSTRTGGPGGSSIGGGGGSRAAAQQQPRRNNGGGSGGRAAAAAGTLHSYRDVQCGGSSLAHWHTFSHFFAELVHDRSWLIAWTCIARHISGSSRNTLVEAAQVETESNVSKRFITF